MYRLSFFILENITGEDGAYIENHMDKARNARHEIEREEKDGHDARQSFRKQAEPSQKLISC